MRSSSHALASRFSRRRAKALKSALAWISDAPASFASAQGLAHGIAAAHEQRRAEAAQRLAEVAQRVEHEGEPVRRGEVAAEDRLVEDEQGHHPIGRCRRPQRGVIVHPEVAVEEQQGNGHGLQATPGAVRSSARRPTDQAASGGDPGRAIAVSG